ncbi:MAG: cytochrome C, partial [Sulfuritalea sp.]|nr:cytochrome C [Sulfuritalea sp.]
MRTNNLAAWIAATAVFLVGSLGGGRVDAATNPAPATQKLDNATCQTCHDGKKGKLEVPKADGEKRELHAVNTDKYAKSAHAKMECVGCHKEIIDNVTPHQKVAGASKVDCAQCHLDLWEAARKDGKAAEKPRLGIVVDNVEAYKKSFHAKQNKDDPTKLNAICSDCHNVHTFDVPLRGTQERKEWHLATPAVCGKCHEDHLEDWTASAHGREATEKKNFKTAVCSDCHTTHDIVGSSTDKAKLAITASCGDCHKDAYE